jgi:hypothetical protein
LICRSIKVLFSQQFVSQRRNTDLRPAYSNIHTHKDLTLTAKRETERWTSDYPRLGIPGYLLLAQNTGSD